MKKHSQNFDLDILDDESAEADFSKKTRDRPVKKKSTERLATKKNKKSIKTEENGFQQKLIAPVMLILTIAICYALLILSR